MLLEAVPDVRAGLMCCVSCVYSLSLTHRLALFDHTRQKDATLETKMSHATRETCATSFSFSARPKSEAYARWLCGPLWYCIRDFPKDMSGFLWLHLSDIDETIGEIRRVNF